MKARIPNQNNMSRNDMMAKIQKMQEDMANKQEEIENSEFSASAGGGAVEVKVSGKHEILSVSIKPEVVDPDDLDVGARGRDGPEEVAADAAESVDAYTNGHGAAPGLGGGRSVARLDGCPGVQSSGPRPP